MEVNCKKVIETIAPQQESHDVTEPIGTLSLHYEGIGGLLKTQRPYIQSSENDLRERIPYTWPSSHENCFHSILGSVSYCVVISRTPPYWSVRVASCNFKLGG